MISYRERELLMVQKMLADKSNEFFEEMTTTLNSMNERKTVENSFKPFIKMNEYSDLVEYARDCGYDTYIRAYDILTEEELKKLKDEYDEIDREFKELTGLSKADYAFMFSAVGLNTVKQFLLKLKLDPDETANQTDGDFHDKYDNPSEIDGSEAAGKYYAPLVQIKNTAKVPYDIVKWTSKDADGNDTGLGLSPKNHRFKSVGHDPILGLVFGTGNILTNTATFYLPKSEKHQTFRMPFSPMATWHIGYADRVTYKDPKITTLASTAIMLKKTIERAKKDPESFIAALIKQIRHIKSDEDSVVGIPIPFLAYFLGSDKAQKLAEKGLNYVNLKQVTYQAMISEFINFLLAFFYRIYIIWDKVKEAPDWKKKLDVILNEQTDEFDDVKMRKIIMYSNLIASIANLVICSGGAVISAIIGNSEMITPFLEHLDIGGYLVTIRHLLKDGTFITKVKKEFIARAIQSDFEEKIMGTFSKNIDDDSVQFVTK